MRQLTLFPPEITIQHGHVCGPLPDDTPVIVSNGVGVDSVAMLVELCRLNLAPDAIITALVGRAGYGNEHRRFYSYLPILETWLADAGFPPSTTSGTKCSDRPDISLTGAWPGIAWLTVPCLLSASGATTVAA